MLQDSFRIKGHLDREDHRAIWNQVLMDKEASGIAFLNSEDTIGKSDVSQLHIMKESSHISSEVSLLWDSTCKNKV